MSALILAGGRGRRMNGQDKGLQDVAGKPLISYVIERIRPQVTSVLISANRNQELYARLAEKVLTDAAGVDEDYAGPLAGIVTGLEAAASTHVLVIPCDTPCLPANLVNRLLTGLDANTPVAIAHDGQRPQQLVMLLDCSIAGQLRNWLIQGGRAVRDWLETQQHAMVQFECTAQFINVNTPEELASFAQNGCEEQR